MKLFFTIAEFFLLIPFTAPAMSDTPEDISGIYRVEREGIMLAPSEARDSCPAPYLKKDDMCIEPDIAPDTLGLFINPDGSAYFSATAFFFNGHSCSVTGTASKTEHGWTYSDAGEEGMEEPSCILDIKIQDDVIHLMAREEANCRIYCGMRGNLEDLTFPLSSKTNEEASLERIKCLLGMEEDTQDCEQYETKQEKQ